MKNMKTKIVIITKLFTIFAALIGLNETVCSARVDNKSDLIKSGEVSIINTGGGTIQNNINILDKS